MANVQDTSAQIDPIPSPIAYLYTMEEVLDQINFTASAVSQLLKLGEPNYVIMTFYIQYFDLSNRAVGTYGYEWADSNQYLENNTKNMRHLTLEVTKYVNGKIDPTYLNAGVKEQDIGEGVNK